MSDSIKRTAHVRDPNVSSPFPYHPYGSVRTHGEVANSEGARLQRLFEDSL